MVQCIFLFKCAYYPPILSVSDPKPLCIRPDGTVFETPNTLNLYSYPALNYTQKKKKTVTISNFESNEKLWVRKRYEQYRVNPTRLHHVPSDLFDSSLTATVFFLCVCVIQLLSLCCLGQEQSRPVAARPKAQPKTSRRCAAHSFFVAPLWAGQLSVSQPN